MARSPLGSSPSCRRALALLVTFALVPGAGAVAEDRDRELEVQVKAEFIDRFTRFVEWPASSFPSGDAPFVVCAVGGGMLAERLRDVLTRSRPGGRSVQFRTPVADAQLGACHLLYVSGSERDRIVDIVRRVRNRPVLSVGDSTGYALHGVVINLYVDETAFVRFEINREAALSGGLKLSARLLSLARLVPARE